MKNNSLRIMTYNLGWLQGEGSEGVGFKKRPKIHFTSGISCVEKLIVDNNIDVACFQEIDFYSKKSHYIDQFHSLKSRLKYFGKKIVSWDVPYLPFPYFNHWGKVVSGGSVISNVEVKDVENVFFGSPKDMFFLKRLFYLDRYVQILTIDFKGKKEYIFNLHLEAFDFKAKKEQLEQINVLIKKYNPIFVAGDFNTIPKGQTLNVDIDYSKDPCVDILPRIMNNYNDIFGKILTFPAGKENCRLDYIWVRKDLKCSLIDLQFTFNPSDHNPLALEIT